MLKIIRDECIGGVYTSGVILGRYLIAFRFGGIQLFDIGSQLIPMHEIPTLIPPSKIYISSLQENIIVFFKTRAYKISIEFGRLVIVRDFNISLKNYKVYEINQRSLKLDNINITLREGENAGIEFEENGNIKILKLFGYSRARSILLQKEKKRFFIFDVGCIRCVSYIDMLLNEEINVGYYDFGWTKDIVFISKTRFICADVFGVRLYELKNNRCILIDRIRKSHFRIAKISLVDKYVCACDEARGIHIFSIVHDKFIPRGGMFFKGGAWVCSSPFDDKNIYVGTGNGYLFEYELTKDVRFLKNIEKDISSPVLNIKSFFNNLVISTRNGCFLYDLSKQICTKLTDGESWTTLQVGSYLIVPIPHKLLLLEYNKEQQSFHIISEIETEEVRELKYDNGIIWSAEGRSGINCYKISEKKKIYRISVYPILGFTRSFDLKGDKIVVAAGDGGMRILTRGTV